MAQRTSNGRALHRAYVASTALVGITLRTAERPSVLHLAASASLLRERIARLLTLAVETPASLLARLNPLGSKRVRKVRPAARVGRRKWREAVMAAAALIGGASAATAQTVDRNWRNGGTSDWNLATNWTQNDAADTAGERAVFGGANNRSPFFSQNTTVGGILFSPGGSQYFISNNGNAVTFTGNIATNSGQQFIYSNTGGVDVAFSGTVGNNITLISTANPDNNAVGTAGGGFRFDAGGQAGQAQVRFDDGGPLTLNTGAGTTLNVGSLAGSGSVRFQQANQTLSVGGLNATTTYSGVIGAGDGAATAGLTKVGTGTFILTGANTYTGATTISGGTLQIGNGGTTGSLATGTAITNNATLALNRSGTYTFGNAVSGSGLITVQGAAGGTVTFSGALTNAGGVNVTDASSTTFSGGATGGVRESGTGARTLSVTGGTLTSGDNSGVFITAGTQTTVNVSSGATIQSSGTSGINRDGITALGQTTVSNSGTIRTDRNAGIALAGGGSIDNSGTITGSNGPGGYGIAVSNTFNADVTLRGTSVVTGGIGGLTFQSTGSNAVSLTQLAGGRLVGSTYGVQANAATAVAISNAGSIASGTLNGDGTITVGGTAGIQLNAGGTITNQNGGVIDSGGRGVSLGAAGTVDNRFNGTIRHTGTANNATGTAAGVYADANLTLTNAGTITTTAGGGNDGVTVLGVATITNTGMRDGSGALIGGLIQSANAAGIAIAGAGSRITNSGTIQGGTGSVGVNLNNGGTITNSGAIQGAVHGIDSGAALTLTNLGGGTISGDSSNGVVVRSGASTVLNAGTITSTMNSGIAVGAGTLTVDNYGSIGSGALGIIAFGSGALTANLYAGSATGSILGSGGNDTVSLYTGAFNQAVVTTPYADAVTGAQSTVTLQNSGAVAAATVGTIALGGGSNTLNLRGAGTYDGVTGTNTTGARGTLNMSTVSGLTTLDKADSGTFVLTGGYVGPNGAPLALTTNVRAGRLIEQVTGGVTSHVFGTGTVDIASGAVVELSGSFLQGVNTFTGAGRIEKTGTGEVRFGSGNGQTIIQQSAGGVIDVQAGLLRGSSSDNGIWTNNRGSLNIASGATFDGVEGTIVVDKLTGAGTLQGGFGGIARTTTIGVDNGSATFDGTIRNAPIASRTGDDGRVGILALTKVGTGTQTLSGANTYTGLTTISAGTLVAANATALGSTAGGTTVANGGNLTIAGVVIGAEAVTLNGGTALTGTGTASLAGAVTLSATSTVTTAAAGDALTLSGAVGGAGGLTKAGAGTLTLAGANAYAGTTTIDAGTLAVTGGNAIANAGTVALTAGGGGTFAVQGSETIGALTGGGAVNNAGAGTVAIAAGQTLTTGAANVSTTYSGAVNGAGALHVAGLTGTNTATFAGALTQTGGFTVEDASNVTIAATGSYVAAANGVVLNGGTFTNRGSVRVTGGRDGTNAVTTSTSVGTIVNNDVGAQIVGQGSGVIQLQGVVVGALTVGNAGLIQGINYDGVTQHGTGALSVTNAGTGVIYGQNAMGSPNGYGVGSDGGGALTLTNDAGGTIVGQYGVVGSNAADRITNAGTIASGRYTAGTGGNPGTITLGGLAGIRLRAGGTVTNQATGRIESAGQGVVSNAGSLSVTNAGTIDSTRESGIFNGNGALSASNTGTISGQNGIDANLASTSAATITVTGNGTITGRAGFGIRAVSGTGDVVLGTTDAALGAVTGTSNAIQAATGGAGTVGIVTGGNVTSTGANAIGIAASGVNGAVTVNHIGGTIQATGSGIDARSTGTGTVTVTAGAITTTNGSGIVATGTSGAVAVTANGAIAAGSTGAARNAGIFLTGNSASNTATVAASTTVQGAIGLRLAGTGTTGLTNSGTIASTATAGANANALQIDGGTLAIGNTPGTLTGNIAIVNAATNGANGPSVLTLANTNAITLANTVTGAGVLNQNGSGTTILNGTNGAANGQFSGTANVNGGILSIGGAGTTGVVFGNTADNSAVVNVDTGGTLHGSGTIAGSVVVNGGTVSAGNSPGTLTVAGNYTLNTGSTSLYELGAPGFVGGASNDLINVGGNLTLAGALRLVAADTAATAPVSGAYRLYNYGGTLAGGFDSVSTPTTNSTALVYTDIPTQVNVLLTNGNQSVQYFDGADTTGAQAGVQGGTGTWNAGNTNWTMLPGGQVNGAWRSGVGIFSGTAGTVTVDGAQNLQGVQFTVDGYQLGGTGTLNLTGDPFTTANQSFANVDTNVGATIANALTSTGGTIGLVKLGAGTLTLSGASTYTGTTTVQAGTLAIAAGGSITSSVANNATFTNAGTVTGNLTNAGIAGNGGTITGMAANAGTLTNSGTIGGGLTNLAGTTTNTGTIDGGATILAGTLGTTGVVNGTVTNAGTLNAQGQINGAVTNGTGATFTQTGALTGIGRLTNDGTVDLSGNDLAIGSLAGSNTAATIANGGTLTAGSDGTSSAYAGTIAGATALTKTGAGTLTLSGANTYAGATTISAGTLQAGAVNAFSAGSAVTIATGARMDLATFNQVIASLSGAGGVTLGSGTLTTGGNDATTTYAGTISGTGGLIKVGTGTFTLSGANSFTGTTAVQAGTLVNAGSLAGPVANAATFSNTGSVAGMLTNTGNATNTGSLNGGVGNSGTLATSGTIAGGLTNTGTVVASAGRIDGAIANNAGTFSVTGNVASNGTLTNAGGATVAITGSGAYGIAGLLTNAGSLTVANGGSLTAPAGIVNSGSIAVAQGGTITDALANSGSVVNDGTYNADVSNTASGTIANRATGVWTGNLTANAGSVSNAGLWQGNARNDAGGTLTNSGTWNTASMPVSNAGTLSNTGTINGGLANGAGSSSNAGTINGAVAVTGGSLATSGTINGAVTNAGAITASGRIAGAVTNLSGGSFALNGPLAGVTRLSNDGTVDLGGTAFTVGSLSGTNGGAVLRNGALTTNGDDSATAYAGTIVDGGSATSLTKLGTGTLTLTGTNTYSGGTTVSGGTLVASAASLGSGPVTSNTALVIDQGNDATLGSALNGTGRFVKQGAGALTYTGTGTLSGPTTVSAGRLSVNGSLANSVVTVASGATLGGSGIVGGVVATAGSAVAPGASPGAVGTLTVAGNVLFASQSLYRLDATASGLSDRIVASGTATLQGGTVQVTAQPGLYAPSTRYTILTAAGGVTGRFSGVTSNFAFLTPFLTYDANDAYLRLARNDQQFGVTAQTRNQGNVAAAAQATGVGTRLYDAIAVLSAPQSRVAYDALSGEIHASAITAQFETATLIREAVLDRLRWGTGTGFGTGIGSQGIGQRFAPGTTLPASYTADLPGRAPSLSSVPTRLVDPQPVALWGQGFGSFGSTASDGNAARLARQTSGFVLGADARVENDWRIGAAGGYSVTNLDVTGRLSSGSVESGYGALYAGGGYGPLQLRLGASYGGNSLTTRRAVTFAGFGENASARYGGSTAQGFAEAGYRVGTALGYLEPFVGGAVIRIGRDGFGETGGASALTAAGRDYDLATSTVGVRAEAQLGSVLGTDLPILVRALVGYRRAYGDVVPSALFAFAGGQQFVTAGIPIDRDAVVGQAGLDWQVAPSTTLGVAYTGQVGTRAQDHGVKGNFTLRF